MQAFYIFWFTKHGVEKNIFMVCAFVQSPDTEATGAYVFPIGKRKTFVDGGHCVIGSRQVERSLPPRSLEGRLGKIRKEGSHTFIAIVYGFPLKVVKHLYTICLPVFPWQGLVWLVVPRTIIPTLDNSILKQKSHRT